MENVAGAGSNVFEGKPDARQSPDVAHKVSRFRPTYRALTDDQKKVHDTIKATADVMEELINACKNLGTRADNGPVPARYAALAITSLEESVMWAVKALTS